MSSDSSGSDLHPPKFLKSLFFNSTITPLFQFCPIVTSEPASRMSLAQHVSSTEGADREWIEPLIDEEFPVGRVLSYDPVPPVHVEDIADHVAAYKVRKRIRYCKHLLSMSKSQSESSIAIFPPVVLPCSLSNLRLFPQTFAQVTGQAMTYPIYT